MCPNCLTPRCRAIRQAILDGMVHFPSGVPPLELNQYLSRAERASYELHVQLKAAIEKLPSPAAIPVQDLGMILGLVKQVEERRHERLRRRCRVEELAEDILDRYRAKLPITRRNLEELLANLGEVLCGYAERCASDLRLAKPVPGCSRHVTETVTKAPYRVLPATASLAATVPVTVAPATTVPAATVPLEAYVLLVVLHSFFRRRALSQALGELESTQFCDAQVQLRRLIGTGHLEPNSNAMVLSTENLPPELRRDLERISEISDWLGRIFTLSYEPYRSEHDSDRRMGPWAQTVATRVFVFLNAGRNAMIEILNRHFVANGLEALPLIQGRGVFATRLKAELQVPIEAIVLPYEELKQRYEALAEEGLDDHSKPKRRKPRPLQAKPGERRKPNERRQMGPDPKTLDGAADS